MPSTTPDLRTVTGGGSSVGVAGGCRSDRLAAEPASVNVDGVRPVRRGGGASDTLERSDFGQASSNDVGGSPDSATKGAAEGGERRSAGESAVRPSARSRSLRDDEENMRLRRGLAAGAGSGGASWRSHARGPPFPCHGSAEHGPALPAPPGAG